MKGLIFNIQRFCVQDGPGIRTTVFFKGCPLRCAWCHNPESQAPQPEILYSPDHCIGCGACAGACPKRLHSLSAKGHVYERAGCDGCGNCAAACPAEALERSGKEAEAEEVLSQVLRDADFYAASGGGLTLSGGEPMAQPDFALELAKGAKKAGIHVCMETCGFCARDGLERILPYIDLFLYDYKLADGEAHKRHTGADNALILENLAFLSASGAKIVLRCPIVPDVNFTPEHFESIARVATRHAGIVRIELEPYHPLGIEKALRLGRTPAYCRKKALSREELEPFAWRLREKLTVPAEIV